MGRGLKSRIQNTRLSTLTDNKVAHTAGPGMDDAPRRCAPRSSPFTSSTSSAASSATSSEMAELIDSPASSGGESDPGPQFRCWPRRDGPLVSFARVNEGFYLRCLDEDASSPTSWDDCGTSGPRTFVRDVIGDVDERGAQEAVSQHIALAVMRHIPSMAHPLRNPQPGGVDAGSPGGERHVAADGRSMSLEALGQVVVRSLLDSVLTAGASLAPPTDHAFVLIGGSNLGQIVAADDGRGGSARRQSLLELVSESSVAGFVTGQGDDKQCPICLEDISPLQRVRTLSCKHQLHDDCFTKYFRFPGMRPNCPCCRACVGGPDQRKQA